jgi:hypothetical protein
MESVDSSGEALPEPRANSRAQHSTGTPIESSQLRNLRFQDRGSIGDKSVSPRRQ